MKKGKGDNKSFIDTPEHQALAQAGITVITPTSTKEEVEGLLGSKEFSDTILSYCGA